MSRHVYPVICRFIVMQAPRKIFVFLVYIACVVPIDFRVLNVVAD